MAGRVVLLDCGDEPLALYERKRHEALARTIAELKQFEFAGYHSEDNPSGDRYFVPHDTVVGTNFARSIGIHTKDHLFGAVVPHWFVATKAIIHHLTTRDAARPAGWESDFTASIANHLLPGYTAFSPAEAREAGLRLLPCGPVRMKDVFAAGGTGQKVVHDRRELDSALEQLVPESRRAWAVVLELNLEDITTYSVGQVTVHGITASYWGTQRTTSNNSGRMAYGGSDLNVVRGGFEHVLGRAQTTEARLAIQAARAFDSAALQSYPEVLASRRNYDVGLGHDARGVFRCGVLDQSWRIGGTSGVEIEAVRIFNRHPKIQFVRASSFFVYGAGAIAPQNAIVYFHGQDDEFGPMLVYTVVHSIR
jgi:hypothetical protein